MSGSCSWTTLSISRIMCSSSPSMTSEPTSARTSLSPNDSSPFLPLLVARSSIVDSGGSS